VALVASVAAHAAVAVITVAGWGRPASPAPPAAAARRDPAGALAGETFEIPTDVTTEPDPLAPPTDPGAASAGGPASSSTKETDAPREVTSTETVAAAPRRRASKAATTAKAAVTEPEGNAEPVAPARYGATGDRSAVDLAAAFTRGIPQAASADPIWVDAPFGSAGTADVLLTLDESGALVGTHATGTAGAALSQALRRTLALLRARSFVAAGKETHLRVTATVTADTVHDGLHGEVFAIGNTFEGLEGTAYFALAVGRRIDLRIRLVK
jgi:hypothetical protein